MTALDAFLRLDGDDDGMRRRAVPRGDGVWRLELTATARGARTIERLDALSGSVASPVTEASGFTSAWGAEFEPVPFDRTGFRAGSLSGRSSHGHSPLVVLHTMAGVLLVSVAWSGNWRVELDASGRIRAGVEPEGFSVELEDGEEVHAPAVYVSTGATVAEAGSRLSAAALRHEVPTSAWASSLPTEWNHWWPYEDAEIDEERFVAEAAAAAEAGLQVATLDAGWFGRADPGSDWQHERGDWDRVNSARFPTGLEATADRTRAAGVEFGIWIEAEAVGASARLRTQHPEILARRSAPSRGPSITVSLDPDDPGFLGYVCLGSPAGRDFVASAIDDVVARTGARWLKLDFNVDPGLGCDRTDHGHGAGDGLFRHYEGLYAVLDAFRERNPGVVLESCSSGGLRFDLGMAAHVHCQFLSDPDWTEHHLQTLWGAALILPPAAILHWSWSQWRGTHADQNRDLGAVTDEEFDRELRAAMLHRFGISLRLTELPAHLRERLGVHVRAFRDLVPLVGSGVLRARTAQPRRHRAGERRPVFQIDGADDHLVAAFALDGPEHLDIRFDGLDPAARYRVTDVAGSGAVYVATGEDLAASPPRRGLSALVRATRIDGEVPA